MEAVLADMNKANPKKTVEEFNKLCTIYQERSMGYCAKSCIKLPFRKANLSNNETRCMKNCYEMVSQFSFEYFDVLSEYIKNK